MLEIQTLRKQTIKPPEFDEETKFLKTENVVTETNSTIKPSRGRFNSRLNTVEERINELEKRVEEAQRTEMVKKKFRRHR